MQTLNSIQTADRIFETGGSRPVLLTCNDMNSYVCKYNNGNGAANRLLCEYIGASFIKQWGLKIPDFALVSINKEHIPSEYKLNSYFFDTICFGLQYSRVFVDVINFSSDNSYNQRKSFPNRNDLLLIALFDIWIANEDRNHNNYNLLIDIENQRNLVPIDHEAIFNSRSLSSPIYELSYEDSLISSPLFANLLHENDFSKLILDEIKDLFHEKVRQCKDNTEEIIGQIPNDWRIIKKDVEIKLFDELFVDNWLISSFNLFLHFLQLNINTRKCNRTLA